MCVCVYFLHVSDCGKVIIAHGSSVESCEARHIGLVDESKDPCTDVRRTETCVAPRHVDASGDFHLYFLRTSSVGGGVALPDFLSCSIFPVQQTTNGIGHRVKYFFGLATNT